MLLLELRRCLVAAGRMSRQIAPLFGLSQNDAHHKAILPLRFSPVIQTGPEEISVGVCRFHSGEWREESGNAITSGTGNCAGYRTRFHGNNYCEKCGYH